VSFNQEIVLTDLQLANAVKWMKSGTLKDAATRLGLSPGPLRKKLIAAGLYDQFRKRRTGRKKADTTPVIRDGWDRDLSRRYLSQSLGVGL